MTMRKAAKRPLRRRPRARPDYFNKLVYDVSEAAEALGLRVPTLNWLIYVFPAQLRSMKIGNRRCIPVSAIKMHIEQRPAAEAEKYPNTVALVRAYRHRGAKAQKYEGRREWDSNPRGSRLAVFKTAAFDRSAIPPTDTARQ